METRIIETRLAQVVRRSPELVEVRFKEGEKLDAGGIAEILDHRARLGAEAPHKVLIVLPAEVDFDMTMITTDHYQGKNMQHHTLAVAWVAGSTTTERMTSIYLTYFPPPFRSAVFTNESEALRWLEDAAIASGQN